MLTSISIASRYMKRYAKSYRRFTNSMRVPHIVTFICPSPKYHDSRNALWMHNGDLDQMSELKPSCS